jgi:hypothetical protein
MIFKIFRHVEGERTSDRHGRIDTPNTLPSESWLFEAPSARYRKIKVKNWKEFAARTSEEGFRVLTIIGQGPPCTCGPNDGCSKCKDPQVGEWLEYIELILLREEDTEMVVAMESSLYVMNDNGKTVDSIHCYSK